MTILMSTTVYTSIIAYIGMVGMEPCSSNSNPIASSFLVGYGLSVLGTCKCGPEHYYDMVHCMPNTWSVRV